MNSDGIEFREPPRRFDFSSAFPVCRSEVPSTAGLAWLHSADPVSVLYLEFDAPFQVLLFNIVFKSMPPRPRDALCKISI